jgi:hypothetical protein
MQRFESVSNASHMKVAQKPRGTATFRRYERVSVCGIWQWRRHSCFLSHRRPFFGVSFLMAGLCASNRTARHWTGAGKGCRTARCPDRRKGYSSVSNFPVPDEIGPLLAAYDHRSVGHQRGERVLFDAVPPSPVRNVAAAHRKSATGSSGTPSDRARSREVLRASVRPPLNRSSQHRI